jgi:RNA polymerase sigma factor (TIGR02999 family)
MLSNPKTGTAAAIFFAAAAEAMRRILVEQARRKRSRKHGGGLQRRPIDDVQPASPEPHHDLLDVDEALRKFADKDPVKAELVKLRYFAGCTIEQAARLLGISSATAERYWAYARAWLHQELLRGENPPSEQPPQEGKKNLANE